MRLSALLANSYLKRAGDCGIDQGHGFYQAEPYHVPRPIHTQTKGILKDPNVKGYLKFIAHEKQWNDKFWTYFFGTMIRNKEVSKAIEYRIVRRACFNQKWARVLHDFRQKRC